MFEEFYEDIPDVGRYLKRIGMEKPKKLDRKSLDDLIFAHQCTVPFENLDVCKYNRPISLTIKDLYEKIVVNKRGGYCFELNGLFMPLLKNLGFDSYCCMVRVGEVEGNPKPVMHRGIITKLDGKLYYGDVGFGGPMPSGTVKFEEGLRQDIRGEIFWFTKKDETWWRLNRINEEGKEQVVLVMSTIPQEAVDFMALSYYCSANPLSHFKQVTLLNVKRTNGHYSITDDVFTSKIDGIKKETKIATEEQFDELAEKYFGVVVK